MSTEENNRYYGGEYQNDESDNRFNRFDSGESGSNEEHSRRPRFVRNDNTGRQYSRVERGSHINDSGDGSYRPKPQYRQYDDADGSERGYGPNRNYGQNRGYGERRSYGQNRPYGQERPYGQRGGYRNYNQDNAGQGNDQPRFYRERMEGDAGGQERQFRPRNSYSPNRGYGDNRGYNESRPRGGYGQPKKKPGIPKGKRIEYHEAVHNPDEEIRLNKFLANAGVCSRREADDFIKAGVVKVNGVTITELGTKVKRGDNVLFHDQLVSIERKIYILLNKPKDCVTTVDDPQERKTVMDYVKNACTERIYPVGRLDRNTTGVLLLTNDGEMATRLTHPKYLKKKIYHARLDRNVSQADMDQLLTGVNIGDGNLVAADEVSYVNEDKSQVGIEIHSGRNRVVRRMFDALGYKVIRLDRVQFAGLTKKKLRRGDWRFLTDKEVSMLRMGAYE